MAARKRAGVEANGDAVGAAAEASGGRLYDMSKFRLHGLGWQSSDGVHGSEVRIQLGLTSYREYVGTNQAPAHWRRRLETDGLAALQAK